MPDGSNAACRDIFHRAYVIIYATARTLPSRFQDVAGRCFQEVPKHSFCGLDEFADKLVKPVTYLATDKYGFAVFDFRDLQKSGTVFVQ